nr:transposon Ty3-I Gag-Pol polyprotein [Tanacetum cinerariifolium]
MRISGFMHGITTPELIKRLHDKISKSVDEMMRTTTAFLRRDVAASNQVQKKTFMEILALDKGKFKAPPPMIPPVEKINSNKFCEFHEKVGHNTDECMHLKRQIKELIKIGKLSHVIKELKQGSEKYQPKAAKKGEASEKDNAMAILMVQPRQRVARKRVTQSFSPDPEISFPPLGDEDGAKGPMIIKADIGVRQKKRSQASERNKAIQEEVKKLMEADIIKEVHYPNWLANPVMVKKYDNSWRMCVDFKDLNKACPKDGYPLPEIDWKVTISKNKKVDALSKIVSTIFAHQTKQVLVEVLKEKSINEAEVLAVVEEEGSTWMDPIYEYFTEETLPGEKKMARAVRLKSKRYAVINEVLYKKSFLGPWLWCVGPLQVNYVLREIHEGSCSMHAGPRSIIVKAIRTGYYWPTMHKDVRKMIRDVKIVRDWCEKLSIHQRFASGKHLQANGLVDRAKRSLKEGIKARLDKGSKDWMEEIPHVIWAHRTMIKSSNEDTLFSLTEQATIRKVRSKAKMEKYYNSKVHNASLKPGDLVYRRNDASYAEDRGKLGPKWEGPYEVCEALGKGAYTLRDPNGKLLPQTWNVHNLKKCYVHEM